MKKTREELEKECAEAKAKAKVEQYQHRGQRYENRIFDGQADDYMTKPFSMVILGKRITALLRRSNPAEKVDVWTYGDLTVNFSGYSAHDASGELEVTAKELDLLKLLVEHPALARGYSQTQYLPFHSCTRKRI